MVIDGSFTARRIIAGVVASLFTAYALLFCFGPRSFDLWTFGFVSGLAAVAILCWSFALRGHIAESRRRMGCVLLGGVILGGIGFAVGFFGPIILTPRGSDPGFAPLRGVFITGPLGLVVGAVLGWLYARVRSSKHKAE